MSVPRVPDGGADPSAPRGPTGRGAGYTVFSYLVAGMLAYGVIGWLVGRAVHAAVLLPVGMLVGLGISMAVIIYRSSRSWPAQSQGSEQPPDRPAARMRQGHAPRSRAMPRERS